MIHLLKLKLILRLLKVGVILTALRTKMNKVSSGIARAAALLDRISELSPFSEQSDTEDEEDITMKKSTFAAILAFLACAVGALTAFAIYLWKREKELSEYEELLFGVDEEDIAEVEEAAEEEIVIPVEEETPAADEPAAE